MAERAPRNNSYLFYPHRDLAKDLLLQIVCNPGMRVESLQEILRAPRPAAPPKGPPKRIRFSFKPSRLAGAISADVRSAERACRSELIMRERRLRSE